MEQQELIPHLFRTEFRMITVVLYKLFGIEHLETAEDLASDTFLSAMETWTYKGVPRTVWCYPLEYINCERIKLAKQLLADSRNSITSVSHQCGLSDANYFVRLFKKSEGITPGIYQDCLNK